MIQLLSKRDAFAILTHARDPHTPLKIVAVDRDAADLWIAHHLGSVPEPTSPARIQVVQAIGITGDSMVFRHQFHSRRSASLPAFLARVERSVQARPGKHIRRTLPHWLVLSVATSTGYALSRDIFVAELVDAVD